MLRKEPGKEETWALETRALSVCLTTPSSVVGDPAGVGGRWPSAVISVLTGLSLVGQRRERAGGCSPLEVSLLSSEKS